MGNIQLQALMLSTLKMAMLLALSLHPEIVLTQTIEQNTFGVNEAAVKNDVMQSSTINFANTHFVINESANQHSIHFAYSGNINKPGLLFIHGTPGSWSAFKRYLKNTELQKDFFIVSVDRSGWGRSELNSKLINGDFALQAQSIKAVIDLYPNKKWTLIGHSLGASIAPKVALIAPKKIKSLLLLAGSLSPDLGRPRWYNRVASTWLISRLIGKNMRYSNREIMSLKTQLTTMDQEIKQKKLASDLVVIQGKNDRLVSPKNPAYVAQEWKSNFNNIEVIELENEGHFLPWKQTELIIETLYRLNQSKALPINN